MDTVQFLNALVNSGTSVIFLWLYWQERKRNSQLHDEMMETQKSCTQQIIDAYLKQQTKNPPALSQNLQS